VFPIRRSNNWHTMQTILDGTFMRYAVSVRRSSYRMVTASRPSIVNKMTCVRLIMLLLILCLPKLGVTKRQCYIGLGFSPSIDARPVYSVLGEW
jgi:hypothetical protein